MLFGCVCCPFANLLGLVLLCIARRNKALGVHVHCLQVRSCLARRGRQTLHLQEGLDVPHLGLVGAVGHGFAFGGQDARSLPLGVLRLLQAEGRKEGRDDADDCSNEKRKFSHCRCRGPYVVTSDVDLVHPVCYRKQELDSKFLVSHIDIRHDLTA